MQARRAATTPHFPLGMLKAMLILIELVCLFLVWKLPSSSETLIRSKGHVVKPISPCLNTTEPGSRAMSPEVRDSRRAVRRALCFLGRHNTGPWAYLSVPAYFLEILSRIENFASNSRKGSIPLSAIQGSFVKAHETQQYLNISERT